MEKVIKLSDIEDSLQEMYKKNEGYREFVKWIEEHTSLIKELMDTSFVENSRYHSIEGFMHNHPGLLKQIQEVSSVENYENLTQEEIEEGIIKLYEKNNNP